MTKKYPIALTIAGSDSSGGAGVQADLKAFSANEVYGASVITAVTAQNTVGVTSVHEIPADVVEKQITTVLADLDVRAIKIGMLFSSQIIHAVETSVGAYDQSIILDPVMIAKSGDKLLRDDAIEGMISNLFKRTTLLTPNLPEAAKLLGTTVAGTLNDMEDQARDLLKLGPKAVLLKGGHAKEETCTDLLVLDNEPAIKLITPRQNTKNTHGTGCTYSSSITAFLAKGLTLESAVIEAHSYLRKAILNADKLSIGSGHGPVHHFHNLWS